MPLRLREGACALVPAAEDSQERAEDLCLRCWLFSPCDSLTEDSRLRGQVRRAHSLEGSFNTAARFKHHVHARHTGDVPRPGSHPASEFPLLPSSV